ncbi:cytochrome b-c1 complex subunit 6, mitochondrial-like [Cimex lectularius]|uniref:Cytochrome b-c1 complex subunit 6 n=1 Tax=Cimex lectularius TaxID=79782 RepID=A0A8I6RRH4_CIMLE|nr:cytochrome b-c1 complex subunit 6, mitochondrial-like [Cimex lectularius]
MPLFGFSMFGKVVPKISAQSDDDEELVDPQVTLKESCEPNCKSFKDRLNECSARVSSKSQTTETCVEELMDFVHCVDHCVAKTLFTKLK